MPEFDTTGIIKRYACNNNGLEERQAYRILKRRTFYAIRWRITSSFPHGILSPIYDYCVGAHEATEDKSMVDMTEEQRQDLFRSACSAVGLSIDPETFNRIEEY